MGVHIQVLELHCAGCGWFQRTSYRTQTSWWCLCDSIFKKNQNAAQSVRNKIKKNEWDMHAREHQDWRRVVRRCSRHQSKDSPAVCGGQHKEKTVTLQLVEDPMMKQVAMPWSNCSLWRTHIGAQEKCEEKSVAERNGYGLTTSLHSPYPFCCLMMEVEESGMKERN